jgi:hypothetical protein
MIAMSRWPIGRQPRRGALGEAVAVVIERDARAEPGHPLAKQQLEPRQRHRIGAERVPGLGKHPLLADIDERYFAAVLQHRADLGRLDARGLADQRHWNPLSPPGLVG